MALMMSLQLSFQRRTQAHMINRLKLKEATNMTGYSKRSEQTSPMQVSIDLRRTGHERVMMTRLSCAPPLRPRLQLYRSDNRVKKGAFCAHVCTTLTRPRNNSPLQRHGESNTTSTRCLKPLAPMSWNRPGDSIHAGRGAEIRYGAPFFHFEFFRSDSFA